jgi:hypothetical protein
MRSGWRQQVLARSVRDRLDLSPEDTGLDQDALWNAGLATVLSDVPRVALAQLSRALPGASQDRAGDVVEVMWARPTPPEQFVDASWFRVRVWDIRAHDAGSADHPWIRVVWGDGTVSGMSLPDVVAIRKATTSELTPMTVPDSILARRAPTPADYDRSRSDEDGHESDI